jgi:hypothetical protein
MQARINAKKLRIALAKIEVLSIAAFARQIGCARPSVYFAMNEPENYPRVYKKILEVVNANPQ